MNTLIQRPDHGRGTHLGRRTRLIWRSRLRLQDLFGVGTLGLRTRRARTAFTALGIAIGIASMVSVLGISASSRSDLLAEIDRLGTNLLRVRPGQNAIGEATTLSADASAMIRRIGPVQSASAVSKLSGRVRRNDREPEDVINGVDAYAADLGLADTLGAHVRVGRWHDDATAQLPTVVLGSVAADRLGITDVEPGARLRIADRWFATIGILDPMPLQPDLDRGAFIGNEAARELLEAKALPSMIYLRADPESLEAVRAVLAQTANPVSPNAVEVSRPSDALAARAHVDQNLQRLMLGLGAVALLVGGIGIANTMVISVLERRTEIGVRRALGATRSHIRRQFVVESSLLSLIGGFLGVASGYGVTVAYARRQGWLIDLPIEGLVLGVSAALAIGAVAGLYPAVRAARLDPADAVRPAA